MLLVQTYLAPSPIHGTGVFAAEHITKGTITWQLHPVYDLIIFKENMPLVPSFVREYLERFAFTDKAGNKVLCGDNDKFMNHSDTPNQHGDLNTMTDTALRDIEIGEELTVNYFDIDRVCAETGKAF